MKRTTVICVKGAGASSRNDSETLSLPLRETMMLFSKIAVFDLFQCSPWRLKMRKIRHRLQSSDHTDGLLFVGKSLGAIRLLESVKKMLEIPRFARTAMVTIDPHDPGRDIPLIWPDVIDWKRNVFQQQEWPEGRPVLGENGAYSSRHGRAEHHNVEVIGVNHSTIVGCSEARWAYIDALKYLTGGATLKYLTGEID